jgi:ring-1,2-phenylacetyl-CoA epoxidase subunit PaaD
MGEARIRSRTDAAWQVLSTVLDPEVPVLSVIDLGLVREVVEQDDGGLCVVLTPTYSGCPATEVIGDAVEQALTAAGLAPLQVVWRRAPAWTTDWISEAGRRKLREYGIAPPAHVGAGLDSGEAVTHVMHVLPRVACPRCDSTDTERLAPFGATACKALYRCRACAEPFEHFKPL